MCAQVANRVTTKTDRNTFKALPPRSSRSQPRTNLGLQAKPIEIPSKPHHQKICGCKQELIKGHRQNRSKSSQSHITRGFRVTGKKGFRVTSKIDRNPLEATPPESSRSQAKRQRSESGMLEAELARLCNVTPMAINKFIHVSL